RYPRGEPDRHALGRPEPVTHVRAQRPEALLVGRAEIDGDAGQPVGAEQESEVDVVLAFVPAGVARVGPDEQQGDQWKRDDGKQSSHDFSSQCVWAASGVGTPCEATRRAVSQAAVSARSASAPHSVRAGASLPARSRTIVVTAPATQCERASPSGPCRHSARIVAARAASPRTYLLLVMAASPPSPW